MTAQYKNKKLWLLGGYSAVIHWVFEAIILTALPVLAAGSIFAVVDLLTGGLLSHQSEGFSLVWSVGQAAAIELLFFSAFMRVAQMASQGRWGKMFGWLLVGLILAVPSFQASVVYGQVHTFGITVQQAITQLGISDMEWIVIRALAVIFVGALEGIAAYTPEGTQKSVQEQVAEMEAKAQLAKAGAKLAQARATAWGKAAKGTFKGVLANNEGEEVEESEASEEAQSPMEDENVVPINRKTGKNGKNGKRKKVVSEAVVKAKIYRLLDTNSNMPLNEIMKRAKCSLSTASKHKNLYKAERAG